MLKIGQVTRAMQRSAPVLTLAKSADSLKGKRGRHFLVYGRKENLLHSGPGIILCIGDKNITIERIEKAGKRLIQRRGGPTQGKRAKKGGAGA